MAQQTIETYTDGVLVSTETVTVPTTPQQVATAQMQEMAAQKPTLSAELANDLATWTAKATATPDTAIAGQFVRLLKGLSVSMDAHIAQAVAVGTLPPTVMTTGSDSAD